MNITRYNVSPVSSVTNYVMQSPPIDSPKNLDIKHLDNTTQIRPFSNPFTKIKVKNKSLKMPILTQKQIEPPKFNEVEIQKGFKGNPVKNKSLDKKLKAEPDPDLEIKRKQFEDYQIKAMLFKQQIIKKKQKEFQDALKALGEVAEICQDGAGAKINEDLDEVDEVVKPINIDEVVKSVHTVKSVQFPPTLNENDKSSSDKIPKDTLLQNFNREVKDIEQQMLSSCSSFKIKIMEQNIKVDRSVALPKQPLHSNRVSRLNFPGSQYEFPLISSSYENSLNNEPQNQSFKQFVTSLGLKTPEESDEPDIEDVKFDKALKSLREAQGISVNLNTTTFVPPQRFIKKAHHLINYAKLLDSETCANPYKNYMYQPFTSKTKKQKQDQSQKKVKIPVIKKVNNLQQTIIEQEKSIQSLERKKFSALFQLYMNTPSKQFTPENNSGREALQKVSNKEKDLNEKISQAKTRIQLLQNQLQVVSNRTLINVQLNNSSTSIASGSPTKKHVFTKIGGSQDLEILIEDDYNMQPKIALSGHNQQSTQMLDNNYSPISSAYRFNKRPIFLEAKASFVSQQSPLTQTNQNSMDILTPIGNIQEDIDGEQVMSFNASPELRKSEESKLQEMQIHKEIDNFMSKANMYLEKASSMEKKQFKQPLISRQKQQEMLPQIKNNLDISISNRQFVQTESSPLPLAPQKSRIQDFIQKFTSVQQIENQLDQLKHYEEMLIHKIAETKQKSYNDHCIMHQKLLEQVQGINPKTPSPEPKKEYQAINQDDQIKQIMESVQKSAEQNLVRNQYKQTSLDLGKYGTYDLETLSKYWPQKKVTPIISNKGINQSVQNFPPLVNSDKKLRKNLKYQKYSKYKQNKHYDRIQQLELIQDIMKKYQ